MLIVYLHTFANLRAPCDTRPWSAAGGEDEANAALDFNAVQRGDAEMSNKLNRVVKACVELQVRPSLFAHGVSPCARA